MSKNKIFWIVVAITTLTIIPFLGLTEFNTKGEPRESIVAVSMLQNGDWILPTNNGGEFAYKPPFFHWCIATLSSIGGEVTLFTSRLPSALATIITILCCYTFFAKRKDTHTAILTSLITLTFFEVHRAAFACRVDMVLTVLIVLALLQLYKWWENGMRGISVTAILFMGLATLTKGPVGIILPCLTMGIFSLIRGEGFWKTVYKFAIMGIAACIIPALWYYAAYNRGGDNFLDLVLEENIGRFTGKMSYESHEQPAIYNVITVIAGCLPWTILALVSLFFLKYKKPTHTIKEYWNHIRGLNPYNLFALLVIAVIFVFYCIPKSKRSVYLLPIYPFIAYYMAIYAQWLINKFPKAIKIFGWIITSLCFTLLLAFATLKYGFIPDSIAGTGKHAAENLAMLRALESIPMSIINLFLIFLSVYAIWKFVRINAEEHVTNKLLYSICGVLIATFISLDGVYQPAVLTTKSDKLVAEKVLELAGDEEITSFVKSPMMHFFGINWYLNNSVGVFNPDMDKSGVILVGQEDYNVLIEKYGDTFEFTEIENFHKRSCDVRQNIMLYRYNIKICQPNSVHLEPNSEDGV